MHNESGQPIELTNVEVYRYDAAAKKYITTTVVQALDRNYGFIHSYVKSEPK